MDPSVAESSNPMGIKRKSGTEEPRAARKRHRLSVPILQGAVQSSLVHRQVARKSTGSTAPKRTAVGIYPHIVHKELDMRRQREITLNTSTSAPVKKAIVLDDSDVEITLNKQPKRKLKNEPRANVIVISSSDEGPSASTSHASTMEKKSKQKSKTIPKPKGDGDIIYLMSSEEETISIKISPSQIQSTIPLTPIAKTSTPAIPIPHMYIRSPRRPPNDTILENKSPSPKSGLSEHHYSTDSANYSRITSSSSAPQTIAPNADVLSRPSRKIPNVTSLDETAIQSSNFDMDVDVTEGPFSSQDTLMHSRTSFLAQPTKPLAEAPLPALPRPPETRIESPVSRARPSLSGCPTSSSSIERDDDIIISSVHNPVALADQMAQLSPASLNKKGSSFPLRSRTSSETFKKPKGKERGRKEERGKEFWPSRSITVPQAKSAVTSEPQLVQISKPTKALDSASPKKNTEDVIDLTLSDSDSELNTSQPSSREKILQTAKSLAHYTKAEAPAAIQPKVDTHVSSPDQLADHLNQLQVNPGKIKAVEKGLRAHLDKKYEAKGKEGNNLSPGPRARRRSTFDAEVSEWMPDYVDDLEDKLADADIEPSDDELDLLPPSVKLQKAGLPEVGILLSDEDFVTAGGSGTPESDKISESSEALEKFIVEKMILNTDETSEDDAPRRSRLRPRKTKVSRSRSRSPNPARRASSSFQSLKAFADSSEESPLESPGPITSNSIAKKTYGGFEIITFESQRNEDPDSFLPKVYMAKDLPSSFHDQISALPTSTRRSEGMPTLFRAIVTEHAAEDEPLAPPLTILNNIDPHIEPVPPWEFLYSNRIWHADDVPKPTMDGLRGCDCHGGCKPNKCPCLLAQRELLSEFLDPDNLEKMPCLYKEDKTLCHVDGQFPIHECNNLCRCDESCRNRVVQQGRRLDVELRKTRDRGWGVFTKKKISEGSFIGVYAGELICDDLAEERGTQYNKFGRTYLLDLDFWYMHDYPVMYCMDAYHTGNFTRYFNHSCDPNLDTYPCYVNNSNLATPLLCLFSIRDIPAEAELCFNYRGRTNDAPVELKEGAVYEDCRCGAKKCAGKFFK